MIFLLAVVSEETSRVRLPAQNVLKGDEWVDSDPQCTTPDGYFPHPLFCDQYYMCAHGISKLYKCPNGLIFSSRKKYDEDICDYTWNTTCSISVVTREYQTIFILSIA